jgi:hypothetical protein
VNEPGESVVAITPPASAPRPIPRFITTRCIANAAGRCSLGVSAAISVDCAGQNPPMPTPATAATTKPCQGSSTSGYPAKPAARMTSATASIRRPPKRSTSTPKIGPATMLTTAVVATMSPAGPSPMSRTLCR